MSKYQAALLEFSMVGDISNQALLSKYAKAHTPVFSRKQGNTEVVVKGTQRVSPHTLCKEVA